MVEAFVFERDLAAICREMKGTNCDVKNKLKKAKTMSIDGLYIGQRRVRPSIQKIGRCGRCQRWGKCISVKGWRHVKCVRSDEIRSASTRSRNVIISLLF